MKIKLAVILALISILMTSVIAHAITWEFRFPTTVTDTTNTTRTYLSVVTNMSGQAFVNQGYLIASGLNSAMNVDGATGRYLLADNKTLSVIPNLPSGGRSTLDLYTGYSPMQTAYSLITGQGGKITTLDSGNLEGFGNFTVSASKVSLSNNGTANITRKGDLLVAYNPLTGNVTANISVPYTVNGVTVVGDNVTFTSNGAVVINYMGDYTVGHFNGFDYTTYMYINPQAINAGGFAGTAFSNTADGLGFFNPVDVWAGAKSVSATDINLLIALADGSVTSNQSGSIPYSGRTVRIRFVRANGSDNATMYAYSTDDGSLIFTGSVNGLGVGTRYRYHYGMNNDGNSGLEISGSFANKTTENVQVTQSATIGEYDVITSANGTVFSLQVGGSTVSANYTDGMINSSDNWTWLENVAYADNITLSVNGTQQLYYAPNAIIVGTTLPDRGSDVTNNPGAITWGTNQGLLIHFLQIISNQNTNASSSNSTVGFIIPTIPVISNWFSQPMLDDSALVDLPFYDMIHQAYLQGGYPTKNVYFLIAFGVATLFLLIALMTTKSFLLGGIVFNVVLFMATNAHGIVPMWIPFSTTITMLAILFLLRNI